MSIWNELPPLDRESSHPLYTQLSSILTNFIKKHQLLPGTLMPTEDELIDKYGVSRATVRQAVQQLETKGLAKKIQGKGTFVADPKTRSQIRFFSSIERWLSMQGLIVQNQLITNITGSPAGWALDLGYPPDGQARIIKRLKLLDERPLAFEHRVLPLDIAALLNEDDINKNALFRALDSFSEAQADKVLYSITATLAAGEDAEILSISIGAPVLVRTGVYQTRTGRCIMAARVVFVAERMDFRLEFHREDNYWGIVSVS
jgi:GntR family transcriptional regulator